MCKKFVCCIFPPYFVACGDDVSICMKSDNKLTAIGLTNTQQISGKRQWSITDGVLTFPLQCSSCQTGGEDQLHWSRIC